MAEAPKYKELKETRRIMERLVITPPKLHEHYANDEKDVDGNEFHKNKNGQRAYENCGTYVIPTSRIEGRYGL